MELIDEFSKIIRYKTYKNQMSTQKYKIFLIMIFFTVAIENTQYYILLE